MLLEVDQENGQGDDGCCAMKGKMQDQRKGPPT